MIVGFREYDGKPSPERLEAGAVLVGPDGVQYEKVKVGSYSSRWKVVGDQDESVSSERMCELVGDGAGWMIAENIPDTLYIVCGAALSVEASDDMMGEALRIADGARLIAAASCDLP